jgi:threonine aldolase
VPGAELAEPVEANEVFIHLPNALVGKLRGAGAGFYDWNPPENNRTLVRLVLSFLTPPRDVDRFLAIARS